MMPLQGSYSAQGRYVRDSDYGGSFFFLILDEFTGRGYL